MELIRNLLIPESVLQPWHREALALAISVKIPWNMSPASEPGGEAFLNFLVLELLPHRLARVSLTDMGLFYNRYYWWLRWPHSCQRQHGPDGSLGEYAFQMLEDTPAELDCEIVKAPDVTGRRGPRLPQPGPGICPALKRRTTTTQPGLPLRDSDMGSDPGSKIGTFF